MSTIQIHAENGKLLGTAHSHGIPRVGEALIFNGQTCRVLDVAHPTERQYGQPIHVTRARVRAEDANWIDGEVPGQLPMVNTIDMTAEQLADRADAYEREAAHLRNKVASLIAVNGHHYA